MPTNNNNWPQLMRELRSLFYRAMLARGRSDTEASLDADTILLTLGAYLGGEQVYIPKIDFLLRTQAGQLNAADLEKAAKSAGITERQFRRIISG